jgi:aminoglycoside phosphotransferase family enzyme/predicted kinase
MSASPGGTATGPSVPDDQSQVIAFLSRPETHGVRHVQCLETHGNLVFLAGPHAYKIKRAVRFGYMDFSTLEKRRNACLREVEINQRWAPDLYLGAVPIMRGTGGLLALGGAGEIVEWAVRMRRFEQNDLLSVRAERGELDRALLIRLAEIVFESHSKATPVGVASGVSAFRDLVASVSCGFAAAGVFDPDTVSRLADAMQRELENSAAIIEERAAHGCVRRCHGDLHLANIVLQNGRPILYDALEFDEALATIDTLYDLAFLLMDIDVRGQRPAANLVLNRYLHCSGQELDLRGLAALPLFLALRAAIRARVTSDRAAQETGDSHQRDVARARHYLAAALAYATPTKPQLVVIAGLSGTGKTTLAASLAPLLGNAPGAIHLRTDLERKAMAGVGEFERLPPTAYTHEARQRVYRRLHDKAAAILRARHAVILDAVYSSQDERSEVEDIARTLDVPLHALWLQGEPATLLARVEARRDDASDATPDVVRRQLTTEIGHLSPQWRTLGVGGSLADTLRAARPLIGLVTDAAS